MLIYVIKIIILNNVVKVLAIIVDQKVTNKKNLKTGMYLFVIIGSQVLCVFYNI